MLWRIISTTMIAMPPMNVLVLVNDASCANNRQRQERGEPFYPTDTTGIHDKTSLPRSDCQDGFPDLRVKALWQVVVTSAAGYSRVVLHAPIAARSVLTFLVVAVLLAQPFSARRWAAGFCKCGFEVLRAPGMQGWPAQQSSRLQAPTRSLQCREFARRYSNRHSETKRPA
jgi:hypothetical protein